MSLSRTLSLLLMHEESPQHPHSSVHSRLFTLHVHLAWHFGVSMLLQLVPQEHLTYIVTFSGAGGLEDKIGKKESWIFIHPSSVGSRYFGCGSRSCSHTWACQCALLICSLHAPAVGGKFSIVPVLLSCLNCLSFWNTLRPHLMNDQKSFMCSSSIGWNKILTKNYWKSFFNQSKGSKPLRTV